MTITLDLEQERDDVEVTYDAQGKEDHRLTDSQLAQQYFRDMHSSTNGETDVQRFVRYVEHVRNGERDRCKLILASVLRGELNLTRAINAIGTGKDP